MPNDTDGPSGCGSGHRLTCSAYFGVVAPGKCRVYSYPARDGLVGGMKGAAVVQLEMLTKSIGCMA